MADCYTCGRWFVHDAAAAQHMSAVGHWPYECETCTFGSCDEWEVQDHMDDLNHWAPQNPCEACNAMFYTPQQARSHMDQTNHWRVHWCAPCQRGFQNANNLKMHLNGSAHRANSIACPFCKKLHTTASGIVHHVETGSCPRAPNVNREIVYKIINQRDPHGLITNKQIAWHNDHNAQTIATTASWNGYGYECGLCRRAFNSLNSLNQHLSSPAHKQNIYHCPGRLCGKQFKALAPLVNHMESESCGVMRFQKVQSSMQGVLTGQRMLAF
ncbi:Putative Zinc finger C2H2-type [Septoria linicola]|uniref:Zinc finger C2H2-type n=1 Tax=Septoria linicola TaxID=215465 RepID=A0A9Q9EMP0_9PEZI|nr:Putative Zinc finger C2H2-type [Septoria linicola]